MKDDRELDSLVNTVHTLSEDIGKVGPTEVLICAAQEQAIRTNYVKYHIDKASESPL